MDFTIGDKVVYNCALVTESSALSRERDHGKVIGLSGEYVIMKFTNDGFGSVHRILKPSISHHPKTQKYSKVVLNKVLRDLPSAVTNRKKRIQMNNHNEVQKELISRTILQDYNENYI